jgi:lysophospholipase L1-like esterase
LNDGVATHSTNAILRNRISEIVALNPDVWVLALGVNDTSFTQSQVYNEAAYCFAQLKSQMTTAVDYVVGPWSTGTSAQTTTLPSLSTGVRQAAVEAGLPFLEPQTGDIVASDGMQLVRGQGPIISGTYTSTNANGGVFFHTDNLHLTQAGHDFIGVWMAAGIQTIESYGAFGRI